MTSGKKSMEGENKYSLFLNIKSDNGIDVLNTFEDEVSCLVFSLFTFNNTNQPRKQNIHNFMTEMKKQAAKY